MWSALIKRYWLISIFKETPENTPYSVLLLGTFVVIFFLLIVMQWMIADVEEIFTFQKSILAAISLLISYGLYTFALLYVSRKSYRIVQTLTCLLAAHIIVHVFAFPLLLVAPWLSETTITQPLALLVGIVYLIATFFLTVWQFMITVHIYKHALAVDYFPAVLASLGLIACNILLVSFWR